jgi:hypothetical protein
MNQRNFSNNKIWNKPKPRTSQRAGSTSTFAKFATNKDKIANIFANQNNKDNDPKKQVKKKVTFSKFNFNLPNFASESTHLFKNWKQRFYNLNWFRQINYQFAKTNFGNLLNYSVAILSVSGLILFFSYLAFFDQNFIIRSYTIKFSDNSYLNHVQANKLTQYIHQNKLYGFIPNNQYFFLNSLNLTTTAKQLYPEIKEVKLVDRVWPNKAVLEVSLTKTSVTLGVKENNQNKYWRVSPQGKIITEDKAGIWENLVTVDRPYTLIQQSKTDTNQKASLQNHSFASEPEQIERFNLTQELWKLFQTKKIKIVSTTYPSLVDSDIIFTTENGTRLYFDATAFTAVNQKARLTKFLETENGGYEFQRHIEDGKMNYIDFRIPNKIFFCRKDQKCVQ